MHVFEPAGMSRSGWPFGSRESLEVAQAYVNDVPQVVPTEQLAALGRDLWNWKATVSYMRPPATCTGSIGFSSSNPLASASR